MFSQKKKQKKKQHWPVPPEAAVSWQVATNLVCKLGHDRWSFQPISGLTITLPPNSALAVATRWTCETNLKKLEEHSFCFSGLPQLLIISQKNNSFCFVGPSGLKGDRKQGGGWGARSEENNWTAHLSSGGGRLFLRWQETHIIPENSECCTMWDL